MFQMNHALPIWAKGCEDEINCRLQFRLTDIRGKAPVLHIATSGTYQLFVGTKFVHYGPARAGRGHFRVDTIDLSPYWTNRKPITVEVAGYNTENYYVMRQTPFLQAELVDAAGGKLLSYTGDGKWEVIRTPGYVQRACRYSFQRPFVESYFIAPDHDDFKAGRTTAHPRLELVTLPGGDLLERGVPYPEYEVRPAHMFSGGCLNSASDTFVTVHAPESTARLI